MNTLILRRIYLVVVVLIVLSISTILFINELTTRVNLTVDEEEDMYFNKTIAFLGNLTLCISYRKPCIVVNVYDLLRTHSFLNKRFSELLNKRGVEYSIIARLEAYLNVSRVNNILYNVSVDLSIIWNDVVKTINLLELMKINNALEIYRYNRLIIDKLIRDLGYVLEVLDYTNYVDYTYVEHVLLLNYSIEAVRNLYELLKEYYELMSILDHHQEKLYSAEELSNITQFLLMNIDLSKLQEFYVKISNFLTQLRTLVETGIGVTDEKIVTLPSAPGVPYD